MYGGLGVACRWEAFPGQEFVGEDARLPAETMGARGAGGTEGTGVPGGTGGTGGTHEPHWRPW